MTVISLKTAASVVAACSACPSSAATGGTCGFTAYCRNGVPDAAKAEEWKDDLDAAGALADDATLAELAARAPACHPDANFLQGVLASR